MLRVAALYAVSGFVSLGYQVAWFRIFTDWFGSTNLTFALVVCNFIGGLGVGALVSERATEWLRSLTGLRDRLRIYGLVELAIGSSVLLTVLAGAIPPELWGTFPYHLDGGVWERDLAHRLIQLAVAVACVFVPCVLMGVTFPLLCNAFVRAPRGERFPATLYAWNTLGACSGVLACQFLFLPWVGHGETFLWMAGANLLLGAYFLATGGAPEARVGGQPASSEVAASPRDPSVAFTCAVLGGLLTGALQGDLFKRVGFAIALNPGATMTFISFWAILAIFLASTVVRLVPRLGLLHLKLAAAAAFLYHVAAWHFAYDLLGAIDRANREGVAAGIAAELFSFPASLTQLFWVVGAFVFVPYALLSPLLPWACNQIQAEHRHLGRAYGANTLAFCAGMVAFTLIAPRVNIFYSLKLGVALLACGALLLWLLPEWRRVRAWQPGIAIGLFAAACLLTPASFDASYLLPGLIPWERYEITALESNAAHTTFVAQVPDEKRLYFGNVSMSGTGPSSQTYMRLMAHYPLLMHPAPKKALLICFGVGNTASAIAAHEAIERIDAVDLNEKVFATAPEFSATHHAVHRDPRIRFIHDDGRTFLRITEERYDLITSEPPPPMAAGVYRLYSREYYEEALAHLTPEGRMSQWLPVYQMPRRAVAQAIATFVDVFPHATLVVGFGADLVLIGGRQPFDLAALQRRFHESERVLEDLRRIHVRTPLDLVARIMRTDASLRRDYSTIRPISDQHNDLEHLLLSGETRTTIPYDPIQILDFVGARSESLRRDLEPRLTHLGRLRFFVRRFPVEGVEKRPDVALSDADWTSIARWHEAYRRSDRMGDLGSAVAALERALALAPEQADLLYILAELEIEQREYARAIAHLRSFQHMLPGEPLGHALQGKALIRSGRGREAAAALRRALALAPDRRETLNNLAWILATHPDAGFRKPAEAVELALRAAELEHGGRPNTLNTLAAAYAAGGRFDRAIPTAEQAIELATELGAERLAATTREQLALYREQRPVVDAALERDAP